MSLGADADWVEWLRAALLPKLDALLQRIGYRAVASSFPTEYAATVHLNEPALETFLEARGFSRNLLSAYKTAPDGRESEGSWRRVDGTWQLHLTLYEADRGDRMDLYAHYERTPESAPRKHYYAVGQSHEKGVRRTRALLDEHDVDHHVREAP